MRRPRGPVLAALLALPVACTGPRYGPGATLAPAAGTVLPSVFHGGLCCLRARLPGEERERLLLLDTGTDRTLLDRSLCQRLGLSLQAPTTVVAGNGAEVTAHGLERLAFLRIGAAEFRSVDAAAIDLQLLREHAALPIDGIAGCDLFRQCLLVIDFPAHTARLLPLAAAPAAAGSAFKGRVPMVGATLGATALDLLVDTGCQQTLALPPELELPWRVPPHAAGEVATLDGLSGQESGRIAGELVVAGLRLRDPWVALAAGAPKLGARALRRCVLTLDAGGGRLWLESRP